MHWDSVPWAALVALSALVVSVAGIIAARSQRSGVQDAELKALKDSASHLVTKQELAAMREAFNAMVASIAEKASKERVHAIEERILVLDDHDAKHFAHSDRREIHEVAMPRDQVAQGFKALEEGQKMLMDRLCEHSEADQRLFDRISKELEKAGDERKSLWLKVANLPQEIVRMMRGGVA